MASETDIANLALVSLLGCQRITSLDDEQTEAITMKASYSFCRDTVLEARAWTFATNRDQWTPTADTVPYGFTYSYLIPSTVIKVLDADDGRKTTTFKWQREKDRIITDAEILYVRYIEKITNVNLFSAGFIDCLSKYLAWFNCISLTENNTLKDSLWVQYNQALEDAGAADGQQGRKEQMRSDSLTRVR